MCKFESAGQIILPDDLVPKSLPQRAVIQKSLVDHIPAMDPPSVPANYRVDMLFHPLQKGLPCQPIPLFVIKHPVRGLTVPDQGMPYDKHSVLFGQINHRIGRFEVINARLGRSEEHTSEL